MRNIPLGVHLPGDSPLHRLPAGWKFGALLAFILLSTFLVTSPPMAALWAAVVVGGYVVARVPVRVARGQILPVVPVLAVLGAFQWWQRGWEFALTTVLVLLASVAAAALLTLTTSLAELMAAVERGLSPFRRVGLPVETISLAVSLTLRLIPLQLATVQEVLAARKARGAGFSLTAFGTPVLVRSIRRARLLAEALIARGAAD